MQSKESGIALPVHNMPLNGLCSGGLLGVSHLGRNPNLAENVSGNFGHVTSMFYLIYFIVEQPVMPNLWVGFSVLLLAI